MFNTNAICYNLTDVRIKPGQLVLFRISIGALNAIWLVQMHALKRNLKSIYLLHLYLIEKYNNVTEIR